MVKNFLGKKLRKKMGRPRTVRDSLRTEHRRIVFCPTEAKEVDALVRQSGKSFSSWAREVILEIVRQDNAE
jgi:hypothetical protein